MCTITTTTDSKQAHKSYYSFNLASKRTHHTSTLFSICQFMDQKVAISTFLADAIAELIVSQKKKPKPPSIYLSLTPRRVGITNNVKLPPIHYL